MKIRELVRKLDKYWTSLNYAQQYSRIKIWVAVIFGFGLHTWAIVTIPMSRHIKGIHIIGEYLYTLAFMLAAMYILVNLVGFVYNHIISPDRYLEDEE